MVSAYARPVFEFESGLILAAKLYSFDGTLFADLNSLKVSRDAAVEERTGQWADEYRKRLLEENANI